MNRPARARRSAPSAPPPPADAGEERPWLRLAMSRGGLGLELDRPFALGLLRVERLAQRLEGLRFPLDLSEGVPRFRHRRGTLVEVSLALAPAELAAALAPQLREALGQPGELRVDPTPSGARVGVSWGDAALAAELVVLHTDPERLFIVPTGARGVGLTTSPHSLVLQVLRVLGRSLGAVRGGALVVDRPLSRLGRALLPLAGGRAPAPGALLLRVVPSNKAEPSIELEGFDVGAAPLSELLASVRELLTLAGPGDDALLAGDLEGARSRWLEALERAPRHPELVERVAWLDVLGDRVEAALSLVVDVRSVTAAGVLGGELLRRTGDTDGAFAAYGAAAAGEASGPLAARAWMRAAELAPDPRAKLEALSEARARSPSLASAHGARLEALAALGDGRGALAAAEELEAVTRGADERRRAWLRAASALTKEGLTREAKSAFERALRFAPDDAAATRGLAMAARELGEGRRALELFQRAARLEEKRGKITDETTCALGEALAELAGDRPAAIARLSLVRAGSPVAPRARRIEAELRDELGDEAGARVALGRLGEQVERLASRELSREALPLASELLLGARLAERLDDAVLARRLAGLAIRLSPKDKVLLGMVRRLGEAARSPRQAEPVAAPPEAGGHTTRPRGATRDPAEPMLDEGLLSSLQARAATLEDRLRGDPSDEAVVSELADLLDRLGRDHELLALASARLEEGASGPVEDDLHAKRRGALLRLGAAARAEGNTADAELYEDMARS